MSLFVEAGLFLPLSSLASREPEIAVPPGHTQAL
jgi:hypothetical protein